MIVLSASSSQIKLLLRKGVKWSMLSKNQFTALHLAAYRVSQRKREREREPDIRQIKRGGGVGGGERESVCVCM